MIKPIIIKKCNNNKHINKKNATTIKTVIKKVQQQKHNKKNATTINTTIKKCNNNKHNNKQTQQQ